MCALCDTCYVIRTNRCIKTVVGLINGVPFVIHVKASGRPVVFELLW